jgi:glycosyltransferase involved in cell wall biosynthesis
MTRPPLPPSTDCKPIDAVAPPAAGRVSVVIPVHNGAATLAAAIDSCLDQSHDDVEVVVVDDGSTDATPEVLAQYGARIRAVRQANGGLAAARNTGMLAASGEFVAWMDADDICRRHRLALQASVLTARPTIDLVCSDFSTFTDPATEQSASHIGSYYSAVRRLGGVAAIYPHAETFCAGADAGNASADAVTLRWGKVYEQLISGNFVHPPTVMVRRRVFERVGLSDPSLRYNSDYDHIVRIARHGEFAFVDAPLLRYRLSALQMSHGAAGGKIPLETTRILEKVRAADPELAARLRPLFRRRLAACFVDAADLLVTSNRLQALRLLWRGTRHQLILRATLRALLRIVVPRPLLAGGKRVRRMLRGAPHAS